MTDSLPYSLDDLSSKDKDLLTKILLDDFPNKERDSVSKHNSVGDKRAVYPYSKESKPDNDKKERIAQCAREHRKRRKEELIYLREKVQKLEEKFESLRNEPLAKKVELRDWESAAKSERELLESSERENSNLKEMLLQQMKLAKTLQGFLMHAPMSHIFQTGSQTRFTLPREDNLRRRGILEFVQYELNMIPSYMMSINSKKHTGRNPFVSFNVQYEQDSVEIEIVRIAAINGYQHEEALNALWRIVHCHFRELFFFDNTADLTVLETIDPNTTYTRCQCRVDFNRDTSSNMPQLESYAIVHREYYNGKSVLIWRCILDDEKYNDSPGCIRHDENGCLEFTTCQNPNGELITSIKMITYFRPAKNTLNVKSGLYTESLFGAVHDINPMAMKLLIDIMNRERANETLRLS